MRLFELTVPAFIRGLDNVSALLGRAADHVAAVGSDPSLLVDARLAPDMLSLAGQVQHASDTSKLSAERLSGIRAPRFVDEERSLIALRKRIDNTTIYMKSIEPSDMIGAEERQVLVVWSEFSANFTGSNYVSLFALPNFYFHVAMVHGILRHAGVPIGKMDYLGRFG